MANPDKRRGNGAQSYRRDLLWKRVRREGRPCQICGRGIDYSLPARHPLCFEMDEVVPFSLGGSLTEYDNVGAAHRYCNGKRGNMPLEEARRRASLPGWWDGLATYGAKTRAKRMNRDAEESRPSREWGGGL